jgi:hypothetical protein
MIVEMIRMIATLNWVTTRTVLNNGLLELVLVIPLITAAG